MIPDRRSVLQASLLGALANFVPSGGTNAALISENVPVTNDPSHDFDFLFGSWNVHHRYLVGRLVGSNEWIEFTGTLRAEPLLGGLGNFDDNTLDKPTGFYRAVTLRSFDPETKRWAIWFLDGRWPHRLDVPVVGKFENRVGTFYANDVNNGKPVKLRFTWDARNPEAPTWEQALSPDDGKSWETNWRMTYVRTARYAPVAG
jgi:hypothetical protein